MCYASSFPVSSLYECFGHSAKMALSSKLETLARMTDSFKTALYDKHVGREAKCVLSNGHVHVVVVMATSDTPGVLYWA